VQLWVSLIPLTWKKCNKEGTGRAIPCTLPPTNLLISLLPAPLQLFGMAVNCKNEINKKKEENIEQEN